MVPRARLSTAIRRQSQPRADSQTGTAACCVTSVDDDDGVDSRGRCHCTAERRGVRLASSRRYDYNEPNHSPVHLSTAYLSATTRTLFVFDH